MPKPSAFPFFGDSTPAYGKASRELHIDRAANHLYGQVLLEVFPTPRISPGMRATSPRKDS
jgi:hypothetical protein